MYKILSLDSGGIRGIISTVVLEKIEQITKTSIGKSFDLITGTSTGSIIAAAIATNKYSVADIKNIFILNKEKIFADRSLIDKIKSYFQPLYEEEGRSRVLKYYLNASLKSAVTDIVIPAYDTRLRMPILFTNKETEWGINYEKIHNCSMYDACMASTAAPSYFPSYKLRVEEREYNLVDGGIYCNNPTMLGVMEALGKGVKLEEIVVVSIGTGSLTRKYKYDQVKNWGKVEWIVPALSMLTDGQSEITDYYCSDLLKNYYRFQTNLCTANDDIDDVSINNINNLLLEGHSLAAKEAVSINKVCELLQLQ